MLQRVLLLLSVAVLLREGDSSSPLDFLRGLKNKIFTSSNTTESTEESTQCSGLDQDGVCTLQNTTVNEMLDESNSTKSTETLDETGIINGTQGSDELDAGQFEVNETTLDNTNNTNNSQYYDEQDWNSTTVNNTVNYRHYSEYPENGENGSDVTEEGSPLNGDENNNQTRKKRQIHRFEIRQKYTKNTSKTPKISTLNPISSSTTVFTEKYENLTADTNKIKFSNKTGDKQLIFKALENITNSTQNEQKIIDFVTTTEELKLPVITDVENKEIGGITVTPNTIEPSNTTMYFSTDTEISGFNDTLNDFSESQNLNESNGNWKTSVNCTTCVAPEQGKIDLKNISFNLGNHLNITESTNFDDMETNKNLTRVDDDNVISQTNITTLIDILDNSTRTIKQIVQNIVPEISEINPETTANQTIDINQINFQNSKVVYDKNNSIEKLKSNNTEIDSNKNYFIQLNSTNSSNTNGENYISNENFGNESFNINNNQSLSDPLALNSSDSTKFENNITNKVGSNYANGNISNIKREKRSINFTILTNDDEEEPDLSISTFPETSESPEIEVLSTTTFSSTESSSWNGTTEAIEVVGPVCSRRYEQCTNSSECCEDYECIATIGNNSTSYCDLQPANITQPTFLPITQDTTD